MTQADDRIVYCTFCGRNNTESAPMIEVRDNVAICAECVKSCVDIIEQNRKLGVEI